MHDGVCVCRRKDAVCRRVCRSFTLACNSYTVTVRFQWIPPMTFVRQGFAPTNEVRAITREPPPVILYSESRVSFRSLGEERVSAWSSAHGRDTVQLFFCPSPCPRFLSFYFSIWMYPINITIHVNVTSTDSHMQWSKEFIVCLYSVGMSHSGFTVSVNSKCLFSIFCDVVLRPCSECFLALVFNDCII